MAALATCILVVHLGWLVLVIFGAFWTRGRPVLSVLHVLALIWGIVVEVGPWPCPLTLAEEHFEALAGQHTLQGSFLLHCVDSTIYPNAPYWLIATCGVAVCAVYLGIYLWRAWAWYRRQ